MPKSRSTNTSFADLVPEGYRVTLGRGEAAPSDPRRALTSEEEDQAERCRKNVALSYFSHDTRYLTEHQNQVVSKYEYRHRDLGNQRNSTRKTLFRNLERFAGSAANSEDLRRWVDEDAPWSFQNPHDKVISSIPKEPTLFSFEDNQVMTDVNQNDAMVRHRSLIAALPTEPMRETFLQLYSDGTLPQNDFQIASRMYEQLIDPESLHSISWTKECKTGLGGTEGRDELMKIFKDELRTLDPDREYDYRIDESSEEESSDGDRP